MAHAQTDGVQVLALWHNEGMTSRLKRRRDPAQPAKLMIDIASGEVEDKKAAPDTAASEFARQGGLKGGRARADKLTPERRAEIAREAAKKRWRKD
jgi:hypothetical protein